MKRIAALVPPSHRVLEAGFLIFSLLICFMPVRAADTRSSASYALTPGTNEFGLWTGGSVASATIFGNTEDRKVFLFALRYGRILGAWESFSLEYTLDIFPAVVEFEPDSVRGHSSIYGAGISPIGLKVNFLQDSWIKPFVAASVGFAYFERDVPVPDSSRFNFTPEIGLGLQFFWTPKTAVTLGYKLHHISNANTGRSNPGMDSHVIYAGFSFFTP